MSNRFQCSICRGVDDVAQYDLYVIGSEGVYLCHACRMAVTTFLRDMRSACGRANVEMAKQRMGRRAVVKAEART